MVYIWREEAPKPRVSCSMLDLAQELREIRASLEKVVETMATSEEEALEATVWLLYARLERLVAIMKLRLSIEQPGILLRVPRPRTSVAEFLVAALESVRETDGLSTPTENGQALRPLQTARNALRAFLAEERRMRMAEKKKSRMRAR